MYVVKMWEFNELGQFDVDAIEPVNSGPLSLNVGDSLVFEPVYHVRQSTQIIFSTFLFHVFSQFKLPEKRQNKGLELCIILLQFLRVFKLYLVKY